MPPDRIAAARDDTLGAEVTSSQFTLEPTQMAPLQ